VPAVPLPVDLRKGSNTAGSVETVSTELGEDETRAVLVEVPAVVNAQIGDVLVAALARACGAWTRSAPLWIDLEGHGREPLFDDVDLSRTVGWFTSIYPVAIRGALAGDPLANLESVARQLQRVPRRGIGFGVLRHLGDRAVRERLAGVPRPEISLNYLGQFGRAGAADRPGFRRAIEPTGAFRSPKDHRQHLLEISASVQDGRFEVVWLYSRNLHRRSTIERVARSYVDELRALVHAARQAARPVHTPGDFARARISQKDLDKVLAAIGGAGERTT
jgi:non-ribosomal peptide synthase protein (TIGR01720 family)